MHAAPLPLTRELVLIGGGHTHALVLRRWGMRPVRGVRLTLVNPDPVAPYTGMLPGHVAGHYTREALEIDLVRLARFAGARLVLDRATGLDRQARLVTLAGRAPILYDTVSIDVGIHSDLPALPGFAEHAIAAKPLDRFAAAWQQVATGDGPVAIAVLGGGVAGVELALAMDHRLAAAKRRREITVIDRGRALDALGGMARRTLLTELRDRGIALRERTEVVAVEPEAVRLADGGTIAADVTLGAAGARPYDWVRALDLPQTGGYLDVDPFLRSTGDPRVYAVGDCAHLAYAPRPKAGVFAVRAAPVLHANLRADMVGRQRRRFAPQRGFLKLVSLGDKRALAEKWGVAPSGGAVWRWKDRIDQAFMDQFRDLRPMPMPAIAGTVARGVRAQRGSQPACAACGAKLGRRSLEVGVHNLPGQRRADVELGRGDDAAVLKIGRNRQVLSTDHLRAFTDDPALLARVAAVHSLGDVWAMGAAPQAALATMIVPDMAARMQSAWLREAMAEAVGVFAEAGADILGGHSSAGAEATIGFAVTGMLDAAPITLAGARAGDVLILTKPLGVGVLLAAEMRMKAKGRWVAAAWAAMGQPQAEAASILTGAHAMTDVTGFGLAGHLIEMCEASGTGAVIDTAALPLLEGAEAMAAAGIRSTLFAENADAVGHLVRGGAGPRRDLLFDPQTGGGLLAAVPPAVADHAVSALSAAGLQAARIGHMVEPPVEVRLLQQGIDL